MDNITRARLPDGTKVEMFLRDNALHNTDGPALRLVAANGVVLEMFFENGILKRAEGPAFSLRHPKGPAALSYSKG